MQQNSTNIPVGSSVPRSENTADEIQKSTRKLVSANTVRSGNSTITADIAKPAEYIEKYEEDIAAEDWPSVKGQFGWLEVNKALIPYLIRRGEKYVSVRMVDKKLFSEYKNMFTKEIHDCYKLDKVQATESEIQLLNEINLRHCDRFYGPKLFSSKDFMVSEKEVKEMLEFFKFCEARLIRKEIIGRSRCGFLKIDSARCIPFIWVEGKQYAALFYFEGEGQSLEKICIDLTGWDLAYLKIAFLAQEIKKPLYDKDTLKVVDLEHIKEFFYVDNASGEFWPMIKNFTREPNVSIKNTGFYKIMKNIQIIPSQTEKQSTTVQKAKEDIPKVPKFRTYAKKDLAYQSCSSSRGQDRMCQNSNESNDYNFNMHKTYARQYPPPLTYSMINKPSATITQPNNNDNINETTNNIQPLIASKPIRIPSIRHMSRLSVSDNTGSNYYKIPNTSECNKEGAYILHPYLIENNILIRCINFVPFNNSVLLVSLEEIASVLKFPISRVHIAINALRIDMYFANSCQFALLRSCGATFTTQTLLTVDSFVEYLPQIKFILAAR